jgi:hypothetical protein
VLSGLWNVLALVEDQPGNFTTGLTVRWLSVIEPDVGL